MNVELVSQYLHRVVERLAAGQFADRVDLTDLTAPDRAQLLLGSDLSTGRVHSGELIFGEPIIASDLESIVERRIDLRDGSARLLLMSAGGSVAVTVAVPTRWLDDDEPITHAILILPDRHTALNGLQYAMAIDGALAPIDLGESLRPKSLLVKLANALDGVDDVTGIRWCDDAARLFGTEPIPSTFFGLPPNFLPIISVGVDNMTLGVFWDRPDTDPIDDTTIFLVSPGGRFTLESKLPLAGWIAGHLRGELGDDADPARIERLRQLLTIVGERRKSAELGPGHAAGQVVQRPKPKTIGDDEQWLPVSVGGSCIRVPGDSTGHEGAGTALLAAATALADAAQILDAGGMYNGYRAMIDPLDRLGRPLLADRCRAVIGERLPICSALPTRPKPAPPVWVVPETAVRVEYDIALSANRRATATVTHDGHELTIDPQHSSPLRLADLPSRTLIALLDTGAIGVGPNNECVSEHGRPICATRIGDHLVVLSEWDRPDSLYFQLEAIVAWDESDAARLALVRYVDARPEIDPLGTGDFGGPLMLKANRALDDVVWPFDVSPDLVRAARPTGSRSAPDVDVLHCQYFQLGGWMISPRAADLLLGGDNDLPAIEVPAPKETLDLRYLALPYSGAIDWERTTWGIYDEVVNGTLVERIGQAGPKTVEDWRSGKVAHAIDRDDAVVSPLVTVLPAAPPVMRLISHGALVRADIAAAWRTAGFVGLALGERSAVFLAPCDVGGEVVEGLPDE